MTQSKISSELKKQYLELLQIPEIYNIHFEDLKKIIEEFVKFEFGTYEIKISNKRIDSTILHIKTGKRKTKQ